jgi:O-antigen ligase
MMIVALVTRHKWVIPKWPLVFLALLVPASLYTLFARPLSEAKDDLSFNISGPFLLFVCCWFFSNFHVSWAVLRRILFAFITPVISIAISLLFFTVTIENIDFGTESNAITSGFFGPNQVSSILGLAALLSLLLYLLFRTGRLEKVVVCALALLFAAQSMLTFSRSGTYNALGALLAVIVVQFADLKSGMRRIIPVALLGAIFLLLVFPYLDEFTSGALQSRFEDTSTTGRAEIAEADFQIFLQNPILGAGVGGAKQLREAYLGKEVGAHTEFARIIAEHGVFGLLSIIALFIGLFLQISRQKINSIKALAAGAAVWSALFMLNTGMRLAAPSFMWGFAFVAVASPQARYRISRDTQN